jgi:two-component system, NtrC family, sensor histidine kinase HydH
MFLSIGSFMSSWTKSLSSLFDRRYQLFLVIGLILLVSGLHYLTSAIHAPFHDIYRRLYYLPIVLGGIWFGLRGGLFTAASVSLLYLPHAMLQLVPFHGNLLEQVLELLIYHVVGGVTGLLSQRERKQQQLYRQTAERLERSYAQLRHQADELIAAEMELRRKERLSTLGEMSAGLAHEIRNPLGSIRLAAEVVTEGLTEDDRRYEFGQILQKEGQRLNNVLEEFLGVIRAPVEETEDALLHDLLGQLKLQLSYDAAQRGIAIAVDADEIRVHLVSAPLKQALLNLGQNALQAMSGGGTLTLTAQQTEDQIEIQVTDTGEGIAADDLEQIFTPFYTTRDEGTGLGLAIAQRLIQGLGGNLSVDSRLGIGTSFKVRLPYSLNRKR